MRWLKRGAIALVVLVLLAAAGAGAVFWVASTESGTAWLVHRLVARAPQVTIARIGGTLLDGLVLEGVRLRTTRDELDIDSLALQWNASALLAGRLAFDDADASRAVYRRVPGIASSGGGPPELPWPLRIDDGSVEELSITVAGTTRFEPESRRSESRR